MLKLISKLETGIFLHFWKYLLSSVEGTNKQLQSPEIDLNTSIALLKSLKKVIENMRNDFDKYKKLGKEISGCNEYEGKNKRRPM